MGPEWWYGRSPQVRLTYDLIDVMARQTTASMVAAVAAGAKASKVADAVKRTPTYPRPWVEPAPKRTLADRVHGLMSILGRG